MKLATAAPFAASTVDVHEELYRLDCWPEQVRQYGDEMKKSATLLAESRRNIDAAEKKLRSWKGEAGEAFRRRCAKLSWACEQARNRATNQAKEAEHIANGIDELANRGATSSRAMAVPVQSDCDYLIAMPDDGSEEYRRAQENVRTTLADIQTMVSVNVGRIPALGAGLNDLTVPRN